MALFYCAQITSLLFASGKAQLTPSFKLFLLEKNEINNQLE